MAKASPACHIMSYSKKQRERARGNAISSEMGAREGAGGWRISLGSGVEGGAWRPHWELGRLCRGETIGLGVLSGRMGRIYG